MGLEEDVERMGEILIEEGLVLQEDIEKAIQDPSIKSGPLAGILQRNVCVRRNELAAFVGTDYRFAQIGNLPEYKPAQDVLAAIKSETAQKYNALPLYKAAGILFVVMSDPTPEALREIRKASNYRVKVLQAPAEAVKKAITEFYLKAPVAITANEPEVATGKEDDDAVPLVSTAEGKDDTAITSRPQVVIRSTVHAAPVDPTPAKMNATKISTNTANASSSRSSCARSTNGKAITSSDGRFPRLRSPNRPTPSLSCSLCCPGGPQE